MSATEVVLTRLRWQRPDEPPRIPLNTGYTCWIAIESKETKSINVFISTWLNFPEPEDGGADLYTADGASFYAVGWCSETQHEDYEHYYSRLIFDTNDTLLGWAPYTPPKFTGVPEKKSNVVPFK